MKPSEPRRLFDLWSKSAGRKFLRYQIVMFVPFAQERIIFEQNGRPPRIPRRSDAASCALVRVLFLRRRKTEFPQDISAPRVARACSERPLR
jgi:hypothetical protein